MAGNQKNRSSTSWWLIINTTILHRNVTMKQKQKKRKLADGKTRERERECDTKCLLWKCRLPSNRVKNSGLYDQLGHVL